MRSVEWWHCRWPWVTSNHPKPPLPIMCILMHFISPWQLKVKSSNFVGSLNMACPSLPMTYCLWKARCHVTVLNIGQISVNIWRTVQDRDTLSMEDQARSQGGSDRSDVSDLEWPWRSFPGSKPFQVQSVQHFAVFYQISSDSALARFLSDSWASCTNRSRMDESNNAWTS